MNYNLQAKRYQITKNNQKNLQVNYSYVHKILKLYKILKINKFKILNTHKILKKEAIPFI